MIKEILLDIKREIEGLKFDAEALHGIRDKEARLLQEQKLIELRMLMRWDSITQNIDKILSSRGNNETTISES